MLDNGQGGVRKPGIRFFAVIVLYKMLPAQSVSFQTLQKAAGELPADSSVEILLYDNTPGGGAVPNLPTGVRYRSAGENLGLPAAFNLAIDLAEEASCNWLITLDQDTALPQDFLVRMAEHARQVEDDHSIAAIVPQINGDGRMLSPNYFWGGFWPRWFERGYAGISNEPTFAFNSASVLRVRALRTLGGYSPWFWLDNCDSALYFQLNRHNKRVFIAGDVRVQHQFSMLRKEERMSVERYRNVLLTESAFWDLAMGRAAGLERTYRLLGRWCKQFFRGRNSASFRRETGKALWRRIIESRKSRIGEWQDAARTQNVVLPSPVKMLAGDLASKSSPAISVIIVNWNGKHHLEVCLTSLRNQCFADFETILVDNDSTDGSVEFVRERFPEVRVVVADRNLGFAAGNNLGLEYAKGDLIALLNNDTKAHPQWLQEINEGSLQFPEAGSFACKMLYFDEPAKIENCGFNISLSGATVEVGRGEPDGQDWHEPRPVFGPCGGAAAYRRSMIAEIGLFDPDFFLIYEDVDLAFRARLHGYVCICLPRATVYHKYRASIGLHSSAHVLNAQRNIELVYLKNMPLALLFCSLPMRLLYEVGAMIYFVKSGSGGDFVRAKMQALRILPQTWKKRRYIHTSRSIGSAELLRLMKPAAFAAKWKKLALLWRSPTASSNNHGALLQDRK